MFDASLSPFVVLGYVHFVFLPGVSNPERGYFLHMQKYNRLITSLDTIFIMWIDVQMTAW